MDNDQVNNCVNITSSQTFKFPTLCHQNTGTVSFQEKESLATTQIKRKYSSKVKYIFSS
jgi:hypothetical protein